MDVKLQKIQITPVKLDAEGNAKTPEAAVIALEVPIDTKGQKDAIIALMGIALGHEWVTVTITEKQLQLDLEARTAEVLSERETVDIMERESDLDMEREADLEVDAETEARLLSEAIEAEGDASTEGQPIAITASE